MPKVIFIPLPRPRLSRRDALGENLSRDARSTRSSRDSGIASALDTPVQSVQDDRYYLL